MVAEEFSQEKIDAQLIKEYPLYFLETTDPQEKFIRCKNSANRTPRRRFLEWGNKGGKTHIGLGEDVAHAIGYRPWLTEDDPDYTIDIPIPNIGLIGCETKAHSVVEKIDPGLRFLIPKLCFPKFKKNPQGYLTTVTLPEDGKGNKCGSQFHIRAYKEDADTFEGLDYHWAHWDEPPPQPILTAAERGKLVTNAPSWFTMTPLKEPYIYDNFTLKAPFDEEIEIIRGEIWHNCADWCNWCKRKFPENNEKNYLGLSIRQIKKCPNCNRTLGFILKAGIDEYLKTLPEEEREAREKGIWRHLSGLVYKTFSRDDHVYEDLSIPRRWTKIEGIDPHDAEATCYLFGAISPEEIEIQGKRRHRIYWFDHLQLKGDLDSMVRQIRVTRETHGYQSPQWIVIDAKYGERTQMEGRCWERELRDRGIGNIILSQSKPGDVELGHKIVRDYLKPHYSTLTGQSKPGMLFAKNGCGGQGGPIHHMTNYQYRVKAPVGNVKPSDEYKDFPDIVRYVALEEPVYQSPEDKARMNEYLKERMEKATSQRRICANTG